VIIVQSYPPLIDEIDCRFNVRGKPILFAWGAYIYNPAGVPVGPELVAHEAVHGERQNVCEEGVEGWWRLYIESPMFRLEEEKPAHVAEFKALCELQRKHWHSERNMRRRLATHVAHKLSSPLYGRLIPFEEAKRFLLAA
jgi:hypothetical protein